MIQDAPADEVPVCDLALCEVERVQKNDDNFVGLNRLQVVRRVEIQRIDFLWERLGEVG